MLPDDKSEVIVERGLERTPWDEPLPAEMYNAFMDWRKDYFRSELVKTIEMHVFVDVSQSAFAVEVYWRIMYEDGDMQVRFV